jgi:hypothetical protein
VDGRRRWCRFNASISAREGRQREEALPKYEADEASSSWLYGKKARHNVATSTGGEMTPGRQKGRDNASWVDANFTGPKK